MPPKSCRACGAPWSVYDRVCECGALVHAEQLAELRTRARIGRMAKDPEMAIGALRRALQLVPEDHPEHEELENELSALLAPPTRPAASDRHQEPKLPKWLAPLGVFGLMLWKLKGALLLILSKGKRFLTGFTK